MPRIKRVADDADDRHVLPDVLQFMQLLWAVVHGLDQTSKRMRSRIGVSRIVDMLSGEQLPRIC